MKCPRTPSRAVMKMGANPHGSRAPDTSDGSETVLKRAPGSLANKALALLRDQQAAAMDPTEGEIIAVLIDSPIVGPVWLAPMLSNPAMAFRFFLLGRYHISIKWNPRSCAGVMNRSLRLAVAGFANAMTSP